ncbi:MAG: ATP-binding protein [Candidatus Aureabacteria bacterium]|nr:ATP-binding protein [Candidatus Auribacterota bacterium]
MDLINAITDIFYVFDLQNKFLFWNKAFKKVSGYSQKELSRMKPTDFFDKKGAQNIEKAIHIVAEKGFNVAEEDFLTKGGRKIPMRFTGILSKPLSGSPMFCGVGVDLIERKKLEAEREALLKWQQEVNTLQQSLLAPATFESKLRIITESIVRIFNVDFCRIWLIQPGDLCEKGCIHAEARGGPYVCLYREECLHLVASSGRYTHIDGKGHSRVPFGCYKIGRVASGEDHKFLTNDVVNDPRVHEHGWARKLGLVSFAGYQLKVPGGETIGVLGLFAKHLITSVEDAILDSLSVTTAFVAQQAAAAKEVSQARSIKAEAEIKSDFTTMVTHELRTPLALINEGASVILDKTLGTINDKQKKCLVIIQKSADRLTRLINGVLDSLKLESGKMEFKMEYSYINKLVEGLQNAMVLLSKKKGLFFELQLCDNLPKVKLDRDKIIQVLTNLANNAIKCTKNGGIIICTSRGDNFIQVMVKDTGIGIKKENMQKLFQAFTQLQRKIGDTGLGLYICKKIIAAHKGRIWAESEFGKGTAVYFTVPIQ